MGHRPVAAVLGALLLTGCGAGPAAGPAVPPSALSPSVGSSSVPALPAVPGVDGEVVRLRTDEAVGGQVQVRLTATGSGFTVTEVALRSPAFGALPATALRAVYPPGRTIDLPVPFGAVDCDVAVQPVAALVVLDRGGGPEEVTVPLAGDALELVAAEQCAVQRLAEHATVAVEDLAVVGDEAIGEVVLTRVDDVDDDEVDDDEGDVVVTSLGRSVLLRPRLDGVPGHLDGEQLRLPLTVAVASCDPHVLAETKKPFVFPLTVEWDDATAVVDLPLTDVQRGELQGLVDQVCG